jgi:hypothetical protein
VTYTLRVHGSRDDPVMSDRIWNGWPGFVSRDNVLHDDVQNGALTHSLFCTINEDLGVHGKIILR